MSYAVLFKIYFYDSFARRQLERLKSRIGDGQLHVIVDETRGGVGPIDHDRVIRVTEDNMVERGFSRGHPQHPMFWYSADYSLFRLFEECPDYDYYVTVEYDAIVNQSLDELVGLMAARGVDFVGRKIAHPVSRWPWRKTCDKIYEIRTIRPYLNSIGFFSCRAIKVLLDRRLQLSRQFAQGEIDQWPISEAFIGTELERANLGLGDLSDYGDISCLDWWPPYHESELDSMKQCTFIHPVLEGERYVDSLLRDGQLYSLFKPGSVVATKLGRLPAREYVPKLMPKLINLRREKTRPPFRIDEVRDALFDRPDPGPNIAQGKRATQSSVSRYSRNANVHDDAAGAVNGLITGTFGFHTDRDARPWWMVDLERCYRLTEIRIFNRLDVPGRARNLIIVVSKTGRNWNEIYRRRASENFGGVYGEPLSIKLPERPIARFIRVELNHQAYLHLDQVKVFGTIADTICC
jgi:F5/8 type C domain